MIITALMVISKDGFLTKGANGNVSSWASREDQEFYLGELANYPLQIMGSGTYDAVKNNIQLETSRLRIVLTTRPQDYTDITDKLLFTSDSPADVVARYDELGFTKAALVGGSKIYSAFLQQNLIDEMFITIEPVTFGSGLPLFTHISLQDLQGFRLASQRPLNTNGTIVRHYTRL